VSSFEITYLYIVWYIPNNLDLYNNACPLLIVILFFSSENSLDVMDTKERFILIMDVVKRTKLCPIYLSHRTVKNQKDTFV